MGRKGVVFIKFSIFTPIYHQAVLLFSLFFPIPIVSFVLPLYANILHQNFLRFSPPPPPLLLFFVFLSSEFCRFIGCSEFQIIRFVVYLNANLNSFVLQSLLGYLFQNFPILLTPLPRAAGTTLKSPFAIIHGAAGKVLDFLA